MVVVLNLEAFAMHDAGTCLVILLLCNPHLLECGERRENGTTDPYRVLPLWWGDDLDLDGRGRQGGDLLLHTIRDTRIHGGATG